MRFELIISLILAIVSMLMAVNTNTTVADMERETYKESYTLFEQMPQIIGGVGELYNAIEHIPSSDEPHVQCEVFLTFTVLENGETNSPKSISSTIQACNKMALKALAQVHFKPGYHLGEPVAAITTLPLNFKMKK